MYVYEAIIVYLAAGAPFAVINVLRNRKRSKADIWLGAATAFLLWLPLVLIKGVRRLSEIRNNSAFAGYARLDAEIDRRVREISDLFNERTLRPAERAKVSDVLEPLERYAALALEIRHGKLASPSDGIDFFRISGHNDEELAAKCLDRRNMRRLGAHRERAADELIESLKRNVANPCIAEIRSRVDEIVDLLGDENMKARLSNAPQTGKQDNSAEEAIFVTKIAA